MEILVYTMIVVDDNMGIFHKLRTACSVAFKRIYSMKRAFEREGRLLTARSAELNVDTKTEHISATSLTDKLKMSFPLCQCLQLHVPSLKT